MKKIFLFSACLLGIECRYDGTSSKNERVEDLYLEYGGLPACPEELGGLPTPREPAAISFEGGARRVITGDGRDVTCFFERGALLLAAAARENGVTHAVLKEGSPSCGVREIHTPRGRGRGCGVAAEKLMAMGVRVYSDEEIEDVEL
jgi:uncharacterized protein YbbK (DUF523 family)